MMTEATPTLDTKLPVSSPVSCSPAVSSSRGLDATVYKSDARKIPHLIEMAALLNSFRVNDSFSDVTITLQNREYRAHKNVLASASAYFRVMFTAGYSESTMAEVPLEETTDLNSEIFATLLDFMYTGELRLTLDTVPQVLGSASYLQIKHAIQVCVDYIDQAFVENELNFEDFLVISAMASNHGIERLKETADRHIAAHFTDICLTEAFSKCMPYQNVSDLLDRTDLLLTCEAEAFDSVMSWLKYDWASRKIHTTSLLGKVRLGLLPLEKIIEEFERHLNEIPECKDIYVDFLKYYALGKKKFVSKVLADNQDTIFTPRDSIKGLVAIGKTSRAFEEGKKIETLSTSFSLPEHTYYGTGHVVALANGELYCAGRGLYGGNLAKYDITREEWVSLSPMNTARANFGFVHFQGYLYAIGGDDASHNPTDKVERYDISRDKWQKIAALPCYRKNGCAPSAVIYKNHIFVCSHRGVNHFVMAFNTFTNKWHVLHSSSLGNYHALHVHVVNETLYLIAFRNVKSKLGVKCSDWKWCPTVFKCKFDLGCKESQPTLTIGESLIQKCVPETDMRVFRIEREVYIIIRGYIYKTRVTIADDQEYDADLSSYAALKSLSKSSYSVTGFSFDRKLIQRVEEERT